MAEAFFKKALFLDRDGTLIVDKDYLSDPAGVELLPDAQAVLLAALERGYLLFLFTNQSGIGRGYFTLADAEACNRRMTELLSLPAPGFTEICIAPEHPEVPVVYRKPSPRFINEMVVKYRLDPVNSYMIGDKLSDVEAGLAAGVQAVLVRNPRAVLPIGAERFDNLNEFARHCL